MTLLDSLDLLAIWHNEIIMANYYQYFIAWSNHSFCINWHYATIYTPVFSKSSGQPTPCCSVPPWWLNLTGCSSNFLSRDGAVATCCLLLTDWYHIVGRALVKFIRCFWPVYRCLYLFRAYHSVLAAVGILSQRLWWLFSHTDAKGKSALISELNTETLLVEFRSAAIWDSVGLPLLLM